jgi:patatin-like phospholipase/acyl hydrolase
MNRFRKNLAIAIDGGGIRGVVVTKALSLVEEKLGYPLHERAGLTAGTSTGAIIAAGLALGLEAKQLNELYLELGNEIFHPSLRTLLWPFLNYRYSNRPLKKALDKYFGEQTIADLWRAKHRIDLVIPTFDIVRNQTHFIKPYKDEPEYSNWPVVKAVMASAAAPTYFPSIDGRYIDGGVGAYGSPCYLAAFEIQMLGWELKETTLISIGTGRNPNDLTRRQVNKTIALAYINPILDAFQISAADQQVNLVEKFFKGLDFRRFQIKLDPAIQMDAASEIPRLIRYGEELGKMIWDDKTDGAMNCIPAAIPGIIKSASRRQTNKNGNPRGSQSRTLTKSARVRQTR